MRWKPIKKIIPATIVLTGLTGCANAFVNPATKERYRVLRIWPLLCHDDGSIILLQKAAEVSSDFADPIKALQACRPIVDNTWDVLDEKNRARDYRWLAT